MLIVCIINSFFDKIKHTSEGDFFFFNKLNLKKQAMLVYCVRCRKKKENLNSKIFKTKNDRIIMQSKCTVCGIKKSRFVKQLIK